MRFTSILVAALAVLLAIPSPAQSADPKAKKKIILVAGKKSHGPVGNGTHDYGWSARLLKVMLENSNIKDQIEVEVYLDDGPGDLRVYEKADTIMVISDGRDGDKFAEAPHLASPEHVQFFDGLMKKGCGFLTFHFSTFTPEKYAEQVLNWSGGYFKWEDDGKRKWFSAIQTIDSDIQLGSADHPVVRGVKPFKMREEFYYNMRFKAKDDSLKPIFVVPALKGREPDGNIVAWAREREGGGRGFGTTCGHFYDNWKNDAFRKTILNAIAWTAKVDVPKEGVEARFYSHEEINKTLGAYPGEKKPEEKKAEADTAIRVLLLAGNDKHKWHNWEKTTPVIKQLLERDPRIKVDVSLDIEDLAKKKLGDYQVIVQNYVNWHDPKGLSEAAQKAFVKFLQDGGGLVLVHFSNGAFHYSLPEANGSDWAEYRKIVRRVWNHTPKDNKPKSGHDAFGKFNVRITDAQHAITAGLKPFDVTDELYFDQDGDEPIDPLIAAESKVTKKIEPLAWTYAYGKGRVFQTLLGHSEKTYDAYEAREMLRRAVAWAGGREVRTLDPSKDVAAEPKKTGGHFGTEILGFPKDADRPLHRLHWGCREMGT
ncbi:MAG: ThuA domain-containing protein [Gemmataceae bacterium]|nr:ThuA domain-containing protein [Gemmataceae bacterium]